MMNPLSADVAQRYHRGCPARWKGRRTTRTEFDGERSLSLSEVRSTLRTRNSLPMNIVPTTEMKHAVINHKEQFADGETHTNTLKGSGRS